jgi:hypothetical protein
LIIFKYVDCVYTEKEVVIFMGFLEQIFLTFGPFGANLIGALVVLILGWLFALIASSLVEKALQRIGIDEKLARTGVTGGKAPAMEPHRWISKLVYYLLLLFVFVAFFQVLGLTLVTQPLNQLLVIVLAYIPKLLAAAVLAIVAWIIAMILKKVVLQVLRAAKVDESLGSRAGLEKAEMPLSQTIAEIVFFLVLLLFLPMILNALALGGLLEPLQLMIGKVLGFLPNLIAAAIILIIGWFIARILQKIVTNLLIAIGTENLSERVGLSKVLGKQGLSGLIGLLVYILILIPVLIAALQALAMEAVTLPISNMLNQMLGVLPALFGAALVVAIFYILGKVIAEIAVNLLAGIGFDKLPELLGIAKPPSEGDSSISEGKKTLSQMMGYLVLAAIMLFAFIEAARILNFTLLADIIYEFIIFAGHVLMGLIIFAIGIYLANLAYKAVISSGMGSASLLAYAAKISILVFAGAMALRQMGLANDIINLAFGLLLGAIAVAIALAFGLGGREIAAQEIKKWLESMK